MVPLPTRPRLKPHVALVPFSRDNLLLRGPGLFARLSGEGVDQLIALLPLLDGSRTVGQVASDAGLSEEDTRDLLDALHADRVLDDAAHDEALDATEEERARLRPQLSFLSQLTSHAPSAQNRVASSRVLLVGRGALARATRAILAESGIRVIVEPPFAGDDLRLVPSDAWARAIAGHDHVVLALDAPMSTALLALNDAALDAGIAWTGAYLDGHEATVGPTVIPRETACWRCYQLRALGAHPNIDRMMAYEAAREQGRAEAAPSRLPSFAPVAAGFLAQAVIQTLSRVTLPPLAGRVLRVAFMDLRAERHRVLRIPRCPACSRDGVPDVDRYSLDPVSLG